MSFPSVTRSAGHPFVWSYGGRARRRLARHADSVLVMIDVPDLLLVDAVVRTMDDETPVASVVAVRDGVVVAVGGDEVAERRGPRTEVVPLGGAALLPGFVDAHVHALAGGLARLGCDLSEVHSLDDYRRVIVDYAAAHDGPWIEGSGWYGDVFPGGFPTRDELDRLVPDRPAAFTSHDVHSIWANCARPGDRRHRPHHTGSRGWTRRAGRVRRADRAPPRDGRRPALAVPPAISPPRCAPPWCEAQAYLHSLGVTSWQDACIGELFGVPDNYEPYRRRRPRRHPRVARHRCAVVVARSAPGPRRASSSTAVVGRTGRFRTTAAKLMLDGVCENLTAAVHDPYVGHEHEHGISMYEPEQLREIARAARGAGFDLHMHAVGDRAVSDALDALAPLASPGRRHQVAHLDLVSRRDLVRMGRVGAIANVSPLWARLDPVLVETKLPLLTTDQQKRHFPFATLHRNGVPVAFGSDWPVSTPDPIAGLHTAVTRTAAPGDVHAPDMRSRTEPLLTVRAPVARRSPARLHARGRACCAARGPRRPHRRGHGRGPRRARPRPLLRRDRGTRHAARPRTYVRGTVVHAT